MKTVTFQPIGVIHFDIKNPNDAPRSVRMAEVIETAVEIFPELGDSAPPIILSKVLLPAPLGPRIAMLLLLGMSKDKSLTT